ncbi:MAG: HAMP domain-containing sensor histidine kinase [Acidimicrobiia bacterium]
MRRVLSSILMVIGVVVALAATLALVSIVATGDGSSKVAREGQVAIMAEATITSASTVRNAAVNAALVAQGNEAGLYSDEAMARSIDQVTRLADEYRSRSEQLAAQLEDDESSLVSDTSASYLAAVDVLLADLATLTADDPLPELDGATYTTTIGALVDVRDQRVADALVLGEYAGRAADGVRFLAIVVIPLLAILMLWSVMKRRRERERLLGELEQQRAVIASKDEFVTNLSHELRTPLTGVYGFALALDEGALDDAATAKELTGLIVSEATDLSRMVDDLITAGQIETGNVALMVEELGLDPEIETVIDPFLRTGATIRFTETGATGIVDRQRFRQILRNLVSNAVKHGGPNIEIFGEQGVGVVSVFVMDDGDGIDDSRLTRLFDRYQHEGAEPLLQGSVGLGLAIARSLALGMGGDLTYTRTSGLTYFVLRVPSLRSGRLNERVEDNALGDQSAARSASEVAKLFAR